MGSHYSERFSDGRFTLTDGGATLHIELTTSSGERQMADIPMTDSRLRRISSEDGFELVEIRVASDALGLQPVATANAEGESGSTPVAASNVVPEGEGDAHALAPATGDHHEPSLNHSHEPTHEAVTDVPIHQPVLGPPEPTDITNTLTAATTTVDVLSNNTTLGVISTAALTPSVPLLSTIDTPVASEASDLVDSGLRGEILDAVADENDYADPALFVAAPHSEADDDDHEIVDRAVEELTEDLLDVLALGAIV
jgi:hypothetical protein